MFSWDSTPGLGLPRGSHSGPGPGPFCRSGGQYAHAPRYALGILNGAAGKLTRFLFPMSSYTERLFFVFVLAFPSSSMHPASYIGATKRHGRNWMIPCFGLFAILTYLVWRVRHRGPSSHCLAFEVSASPWFDQIWHRKLLYLILVHTSPREKPHPTDYSKTRW